MKIEIIGGGFSSGGGGEMAAAGAGAATRSQKLKTTEEIRWGNVCRRIAVTSDYTTVTTREGVNFT